jgi:hypothetical protein
MSPFKGLISSNQKSKPPTLGLVLFPIDEDGIDSLDPPNIKFPFGNKLIMLK